MAVAKRERSKEDMTKVKEQGEKVIRTVCWHQNGLLCGLLAHVKDGVMTKLEPADFPESEWRHACIKGLAGARYVYHPDRLKYPMKRVGERGEGKWQRISWDEALDTIASRLKDIGERYGPESVAYMCMRLDFPCGGFFIGQRFASATGGTFVGLVGIGAAAGFTANQLEYGDMWVDYLWDHEDPRMVVIWGENMLDTAGHKYPRVRDAREKGAKMVAIGPIFNATAAKADEWIPIRPGTDAALALGMINVILSEGLCDEPFLIEHTVGPFLVRGDNGRFLRERHLSSGDSTTKYMMWDTKTNKPQTYDTPGVAPALRGSYTVDGIECKTALQLLAELAEQYTLERVSEITEVAPDVIRRLALDHAIRKPVASYKGLGMQRTFYGDLAYRAINTLAAVTGNVAKRPWLNFFTELDFASFMFPGMRFYKSLPVVQFYEAAVMGEPYPIKAMWITGHNPADAHGNTNKYKKAVENLEFIVAVDIFMSSTAEYADIVLPSCTSYEYTSVALPVGAFLGGGPYYQLNEKVIEPLYECKTDMDIFNKLAQRMGLGEFFNKSVEEYVEDLFSSSGHPSIKDVTVEKLKEGPVRHPYADRLFNTPSGRLEFYAERMKEFGQELPVFIEPPESARQSLAQKYPLSLFNTHSKARHHTIFGNVDWLRELEPEPTLDINPVDAEKRGIQDGDIVTAFNDRGSVTLKARFNEGMKPGCVSVGEGWQARDFIKGSHNELTATAINPAQQGAFEPMAQIQGVMVELRKAEEG